MKTPIKGRGKYKVLEQLNFLGISPTLIGLSLSLRDGSIGRIQEVRLGNTYPILIQTEDGRMIRAPLKFIRARTDIQWGSFKL